MTREDLLKGKRCYAEEFGKTSNIRPDVKHVVVIFQPRRHHRLIIPVVFGSCLRRLSWPPSTKNLVWQTLEALQHLPRQGG